MKSLNMNRNQDQAGWEQRGPSPQPNPSRYGPYHHAAAVLTTYDDATLRPTRGAKDASIDDLLDDSTMVAGTQGQIRWALLPKVRRAVLLEMACRPTLQRALASNTDRPDNPTQQMLEAYIFGDAPPVEQQSSEQLTATYQVIEWLQNIIEDLPDRKIVRQRQEFMSLLQPFYDLAGRHFGGRRREMKILHDYVGVLKPGSRRPIPADRGTAITDLRQKPPLVISGPGGTGKSTLLARFIWEHVTLPQTDRFPWTYIDFDRPCLQAEEPISLLMEAVRQLGIQYPEARPFCDGVCKDWRKKLEHILVRAQYAQTSTPTALDRAEDELPPSPLTGPDDWERFMHDFASLLYNLKVETDPFLFVLDTFEEVQYRSDAIVNSLLLFIQILQRHVPRLRTVLVGRAPVPSTGDFPTHGIELGDFDKEAAQGFLEAHGVTPPEARIITERFGGNPLTLKLALEVWRSNPGELLALRVRKNQVQGQLFTRILNHIHNPNVRKLAYPGLVLRRITPGLIREVLAGPCDVRIDDDATAQALFDEMRREVSLVTYEGGALRHRPDVRQIMLRLLREQGRGKVSQIEAAAVQYYEQRTEIVDHAEEIYHRLSLRQPLPEIEARWDHRVRPYLASAPDELDHRERIWLKQKLGRKISTEDRRKADLDAWEWATEREVSDLLAARKYEQALAALGEREERTTGSPLYLLEAQALESLAAWEAQLRLIDRGIISADRCGNRSMAVDLMIHGARAYMSLADYDAASQRLEEARDLLTGDGDPLQPLEIDLHRLELNQRIIRATATKEQQRAAIESTRAVKAGLKELFDQLSEQQIAAHPALMGWLAREVGEEQPAILLRIVEQTGIVTEQQGLLRHLGRALAAWDNNLSATSKGPKWPLAQWAGVAEAQPDWQHIVFDAEEAQTLGQLIARLLRNVTPVPPEVTSVLAALLAERARDITLPAVEDVAPATQTNQITGVASPDPKSLTKGMKHLPEMTTISVETSHGGRSSRTNRRQLSQIIDALLNAFSVEELDDMLLYRLDRSRSSIALGTNPKEIAHRIVVAADREGWLVSLVAAARDARPADSNLYEIASEFGLTATSIQNRQIRRSITQLGPALNPRTWSARLGRIETQICRVEILFNGTHQFGTGFLLGSDILMTCYHILERVIKGEVKPKEVQCRFDYKELENGTTVNRGTVYGLAEDWLIDYSRYSQTDLVVGSTALPQPDELDYVLVRLAGSPGHEPVGSERAEHDAVPRGWIHFPESSGEIQPAMPLFIVHHPHGKPLKLSMDQNAVIGLNDNGTRVRYQIFLEAGSGGAPCFDSNWNLIAMHQARDPDFSSKNNAPYWQGIPIAAILRLLKQRGKHEVLGGQSF